MFDGIGPAKNEPIAKDQLLSWYLKLPEREIWRVYRNRLDN